MFKFLFVLVLVFLPCSLLASVYKCTINGVVTYSQSPCGEVEQEVKKYKLEEETKRKPSSSQNQEHFASKNTKELMRSAKLYTINSKIKRYKANIQTYHKKMNNEIKRLKTRTAYANNNLAGATYQAALSNEMVAVSNKYQSLIDTEEAKVKELQLEAESLIKQSTD